jgi:sugar phosphate isomerase/epimerase
MEILYFCTTWGQKKLTWDDFFEKIKATGYDGVETDLPPGHETDEFLAGLEKHQLKYIGQHWETVTVDFDQHKLEYTQRLIKLADLHPMFINSHTGKDHFSIEQNCELIKLAERVETLTEVPIIHETHRGRFAYAAHVTAKYLELMPELRLTLDISHWCTVAESLLQDQLPAVNQAIARTSHIHARIGFEQGPQVFDPADDDSVAALNFHLQCWDSVIEQHRQAGYSSLTITTEFGPLPYMPGRQAAAKQCEYNLYMLKLLKDRYNTN